MQDVVTIFTVSHCVMLGVGLAFFFRGLDCLHNRSAGGAGTQIDRFFSPAYTPGPFGTGIARSSYVPVYSKFNSFLTKPSHRMCPLWARNRQ